MKAAQGRSRAKTVLPSAPPLGPIQHRYLPEVGVALQNQGNEQSGYADQDNGPLPANHFGDDHHGEWCDSATGKSGYRMNAKGLSHHLGVDTSIENRVVGRVINRVGETRRNHHKHDNPVRGCKPPSPSARAPVWLQQQSKA